MKKDIILLLCLMYVFIVPQGRSRERIEDTVFLPHGSSNQFDIPLEKDEVISIKFETYNSSFLATLTFYLHSFEFICIDKKEGSYTIEIDETNYYHFGVYNKDDFDGYVHYIIENKESSISGYPLIVMFGIIGIFITGKIIKRGYKKTRVVKQ